MYSEKVMEHFRHPHNMGEIENPDAQGEVGNPVCGDMMKVTMKINPETKIIEDIKFKTFGCVSAIACSSVTTDILMGKTLEDAKKFAMAQKMPGNERLELARQKDFGASKLGFGANIKTTPGPSTR